jgi:hypothetical protein
VRNPSFISTSSADMMTTRFASPSAPLFVVRVYGELRVLPEVRRLEADVIGLGIAAAVALEWTGWPSVREVTVNRPQCT